jgi:hypothetical protein
MGLRPARDGWLEPDGNCDWQLNLKRSLLAAHRATYVLDPMSASAQSGVSHLAALLSTEDTVEPTIEACGLATQEDWCVMVREDTWRLRAACVCFPSRWVLAHKVGGTVSEIHAPVQRYEQDLGGLVEGFFDRLDHDRVMWRINWNLWDDPRLSQPWTNEDAPDFDLPTVDQVPERVVLRVERQTVRRLTEDAIAFSIRVHQRPLGNVALQAGALEQLRNTLCGEAGASLAAKKLGRLRSPVLDWLEVSAAPSVRPEPK